MVKSQAVRLVDVFLLGPFMMWMAGRSSAPEWARATLAAAGALTILYNGRNYLEGGR